jgi:uncharacterized protein YjcR
MMSKMDELAYDIEQMYIEGYKPTTIAGLLGCELSLVYDWIETNGLSAEETSYDPYDTVNS